MNKRAATVERRSPRCSSSRAVCGFCIPEKLFRHAVVQVAHPVPLYRDKVAHECIALLYRSVVQRTRPELVQFGRIYAASEERKRVGCTSGRIRERGVRLAVNSRARSASRPDATSRQSDSMLPAGCWRQPTSSSPRSPSRPASGIKAISPRRSSNSAASRRVNTADAIGKHSSPPECLPRSARSGIISSLWSQNRR